ncbi:MAG: zinc-binding dehydrogenase [Planctomycetes bacterium]|nr:zinc-binding dehydrogenase [Planctomycetota bacterium]MBM4056654.1 zinc-binding dehydrogenase [Planctomycetota bacterium]
MRAAVYESFRGPIAVRDLPDPVPHDDAVLVAVRACGICRSDWHGWQGHDAMVRLPHVPGHELAGYVAAVGAAVRGWRGGERVTAPFCCGCGTCPDCRRGDTQVCPRQTQPGFSHFGGFAELVEIRHADLNLVALPDGVGFIAAASLGCRFSTAYRAVVQQGRAAAGDWVAIHGCGGVGLSAIMIARATGARVIAVDPAAARRAMARAVGAEEVLDPTAGDVASRIRAATGGGAAVSIDCIGAAEVCRQSVLSLANRGRHVQVGLLTGDQATPPLPMDVVIARELELLGSHGMPVGAYRDLLGLVAAGTLGPERLVSDTVDLEAGARLLEQFDSFPNRGMTVIGFPG